jgi:membrane protease YdiL (CAAX protease family)
MPNSAPPIVQVLEWSIWVGSASCWIWLLASFAKRKAVLPIEPREQVPWTGFDLLGLLLLAILMSAAISYYGFQVVEVPLPTQGEALTSAQSIVALTSDAGTKLSFVALAAILLHYRVCATAVDFGVRLGSLGRDISTGLIVFLLLAPILFGIQFFFDQVLGIRYVHPIITAVNQHPSKAMFLASLVSAVIAAPLAEEFVFRVLIQGWLEKCEVMLAQRNDAPQNPDGVSEIDRRELPLGVLPIGITSLLFALMHIGHGAAPIPLFLLSLALGFLYQRTHRLWPSLAAHAALNLVTFAMIWLVPMPPAN